MWIHCYLRHMLRPWNHKGRHSSNQQCFQEESGTYVKITHLSGPELQEFVQSLLHSALSQHSQGTLPCRCSPRSCSCNTSVSLYPFAGVHQFAVALFPLLSLPICTTRQLFLLWTSLGRDQHGKILLSATLPSRVHPHHKGMDDGKRQIGSYLYMAPEKTVPQRKDTPQRARFSQGGPQNYHALCYESSQLGRPYHLHRLNKQCLKWRVQARIFSFNIVPWVFYKIHISNYTCATLHKSIRTGLDKKWKMSLTWNSNE